MKVLYDFHIFMLQKYGGISRYYSELIGASHELYEANVAIEYHINHYLEKFLHSKDYPWDCRGAFGGISFPGKGIFCDFIAKHFGCTDVWQVNREIVINSLQNKVFDVFHPTYYSNYYFEHLGKTPFILTVYDMIHEIFPEKYMVDDTVKLKREAIKKANHIIAISNKTKTDIIEIYRIPENNISVIHLASSLPDVTNLGFEINYLPKRYILYVGMRSGYKNFYIFLRAMADLLNEDDTLKLVCTGKPFNKQELSFVDSLGVSKGKILHMSVTDRELALLYKNAQVFAFPSLYEGFGLPVLEAFECGCPVVLSRTGSLPEVGGDAAIYFDPKSVGEIRNAVEKYLNNEQLRKDYITRGYARLKEFSWDNTRRETAKIYNMIA